MIQIRIDKCLEIIDEIELGAKNSLEGLQLTCISKLVLHSGLRQYEIPKLRVKDIISKNGIVAKSIDRFKNEIFFNDEAVRAVQHYFNEMNAKNHLLSKRKSPLFPSYRNVEKLKRHWKKAGITFAEIRKVGYHLFNMKARNQGVTDIAILEQGARQLSVTPRQVRAVVTGKKIMPGKTRKDIELLEMLKNAEEEGRRLSDPKPAEIPKSDSPQSAQPKSLTDLIK